MQSSPIKKSDRKAFQEYAKERSTALKAAYPMKSNGEIIKMIEKQWMDTHQKSYKKSEISAKSKDQDLSYGAKSAEKSKDSVKKELVFSSLRKVPKIQEEIKQQSEIKEEALKDSSEQASEEDIKSTSTKKAKKIFKRMEEMKFSRFYTKKLKLEHPKWNTSQIATIVKLLWRKKNTTDKIQTKIPIRRNQVLTGPKMFNTKADLTNEAIAFSWKALPRESKKYWKMRGLGIPISYETPNKGQNTRIGLSIALNSPLSFKNESPLNVGSLSFMNKIM